MPRDRDWLNVRRALETPRPSTGESVVGPVTPCAGSTCLDTVRLPHVHVTATPA